MSIVIVTGGFDPIHSGHISYINAAKQLGDTLIVGLNSDDWLIRKKGRFFMPWHERSIIISNLKSVDSVIDFDDTDESAKDCIRCVRKMYPTQTIIFANGGDRTKRNITEMDIEDGNVIFEFGVGGVNKENSSSWILQEWKAPKTNRIWGCYRNLYEQDQEVKVKELVVEPGKYLSMQKHEKRSEHWFISEGTATVYTVNNSKTDVELYGIFEKFQHVHISKNEWHQLVNETNQLLKIVEIQYGEQCIEEDIERVSVKNNFNLNM